jgi:hypothetical protein
MTTRKLEAKGITPEDIHDLADVLGIPWDHDRKFMKFTRTVTGKEFLDDLSQPQLLLVYNALVREGNRKQEQTTSCTTAEISAGARKYLKEHPDLRTQLAQFEQTKASKNTKL